MKAWNWDSWMQEWLKAHPVKEPPPELLRTYQQEVMARIRVERNPAGIYVWRPPLRWTLGLGGALATALAVAALMVRSPTHLSRQIEQETLVLFEAEGVASLNDADLEEEVQAQDRIVLAEAVENETLELWEEIEEVGANPAEGEVGSNEEWLRELQNLDEEEMALS